MNATAAHDNSRAITSEQWLIVAAIRQAKYDFVAGGSRRAEIEAWLYGKGFANACEYLGLHPDYVRRLFLQLEIRSEIRGLIRTAVKTAHLPGGAIEVVLECGHRIVISRRSRGCGDKHRCRECAKSALKESNGSLE